MTRAVLVALLVTASARLAAAVPALQQVKPVAPAATRDTRPAPAPSRRRDPGSSTGGRTLVVAGSATTDDRGIYRMTGLLPGLAISLAEGQTLTQDVRVR